MSFKGQKNIYICQKCSAEMVTIDRDEGTTPFITRCHAFVKGRECMGDMQSGMYRCDQALNPTHEWVRMSDGEAANSSPGVMRHHLLGGLVLREIASGEKA